MLDDLKALINPGESILYEGRPEKRCFVFESIFNPLLPFAALWAAIDLSILGATFADEVASQTPVIFVLIPFMLLHMMPVWIYLGGVLFTSLKHHNTAYIITDKSIYISGGTFTKNIQTFSFSDVSNIEIHRGLFDQMFNVGDIIVTSYNRDHNGKRVTANISSISGYLDIYNLVNDIYNNEKNNY